MAGTSGVLSSSEQIQANYEKYKSKFKDATENMVSSDTFLSLLVAEMTNQDPMEPTSNTEFVTQMAQFTSLQYSKDAATYSQSNYASSLVGKTVTASKMDGSKQVTKTGVVQSVMKNGDKYTLKIDGVSFELFQHHLYFGERFFRHRQLQHFARRTYRKGFDDDRHERYSKSHGKRRIAAGFGHNHICTGQGRSGARYHQRQGLCAGRHR